MRYLIKRVPAHFEFLPRPSAADGSIEWVKLENLYNFDGKPGFARGQGQ
jgi:hypothetical protein